MSLSEGPSPGQSLEKRSHESFSYSVKSQDVRVATPHNFIELFNKYWFSSYYGPGTILNAL